MATIEDVTSILKSGVSTTDALIDDGPAWNYLTTTPGNVIYFSFQLDNSYTTQVRNVEQFSTGQQNAARDALSYVSSVTGIDFVETNNVSQAHMFFYGADIIASSVSGLAASQSAYSFTNNNIVTQYDVSVDIFLDVNNFAHLNDNPVPGSFGYETLLHEVGHALGLKHPFEGTDQLPSSVDNTNFTVMSYTQAGGIKSTYQQFDLDALEWIYGGDGLGGQFGLNSSQGINEEPNETPSEEINRSPVITSSTELTAFENSIFNYTFTANDVDGDVLNYQSNDLPDWLNFNEQTGVLSGTPDFTDAGDYAFELIVNDGNVEVKQLFNLAVENVLLRINGSFGDDVLTGSAVEEVINAFSGNDFIVGSSGNDFIKGDSGIDVVSYDALSTAFDFSFGSKQDVVVSSTLFGEDNLTNIERLVFSDLAYANDIDGSAGTAAKIIITTLGEEQVSTFMALVLEFTDEGRTLTELFDLIVDINLIESTIGDSSNKGFVNHVFENVVGRAATAAESDNFTQLLDDNTFTKSSLLEFAAETNLVENTVQALSIDIIGIAYDIA